LPKRIAKLSFSIAGLLFAAGNAVQRKFNQMINQTGFEVIVGLGPENSLNIGIERSY
jgi:hypothetical protein